MRKPILLAALVLLFTFAIYLLRGAPATPALAPLESATSSSLAPLAVVPVIAAPVLSAPSKGERRNAHPIAAAMQTAPLPPVIVDTDAETLTQAAPDLSPKKWGKAQRAIEIRDLQVSEREPCRVSRCEYDRRQGLNLIGLVVHTDLPKAGFRGQLRDGHFAERTPGLYLD